MRRDGDRRERAGRVIGLLALGVAGGQLARFLAPDRAVDDAWISFRIARNLVEHGALTYDTAAPPVEGMTNLTWTLLAAGWIAALPDLDPIWPARLLGAALHLATVALLADLGRRLAGPAGALAALLWALSGWTAFYAMSGLETPLWTLLFVVALHRFHAAARGDGRAWLQVGVALGLLAVTRPEGVMVGGLVAVGALATGGRAALGAALPFLAAVAGVEAFRLGYYGELVPNTFHAKPPAPAAGLGYALRWAGWGAGGTGLLLALAGSRGRGGRALLALGATLVAAAALSGGDWMPGFRRLSLAHVVLVLLAARGLGRLPRPAAAAALVAWVAALGLASARGVDAARFGSEPLADLGRRARATPAITDVALLDIGRFGWEFPGRIYDLAGLTDRRIARRPGAHTEKAWDEAYFRERAPELCLVRTTTPLAVPLPAPPVVGHPDDRLLRSVLDHGGYRIHGQVALGGGRYLWLLVRDGIALPPATWGPGLDLDPRAIWPR